MLKVYLQKVVQHGNVAYIGKIDPRILVRIAAKVEMGDTQDAQRPLSKKRVKEIAAYVSQSSGILPSTLTISTKNDKIKIESCQEIAGFFYTYFPNQESEYANFEDSIDVMDGQHRLYSFLSDMILIPDDEEYEIGFTLYDKPSLSQKRKVFVSCNEKQEKVSPNLLLWFKEKLNMLGNDEKRYYNIVSQLSDEYPLNGHIIMSAESVKNGVKAQQIIADLKHINILNFHTPEGELSDESIVRMLKTYLCAWQEVVGFNFATSSSKEAGAAVKMAGLKYMLYILPAVWDYSFVCRSLFTQEYCKTTLQKMIAKHGVPREEFFTNKENINAFRERTMISQLAEKSQSYIKTLGSENFNPLA